MCEQVFYTTFSLQPLPGTPIEDTWTVEEFYQLIDAVCDGRKDEECWATDED